MLRVLCFGDSNTWGAVCGAGRWARLPREKRWTGVLERALNGQAEVIEEGCCGRTTMWDDPSMPGRNGLTVLASLLESHRPLDLVILLLGTNDLKACYARTAEQIAGGAERLIRQIGEYPCGHDEEDRPQVLLIAPTLVRAEAAETFEGMFTARAAEVSRALPAALRVVADRTGCAWIDATRLTPSGSDAVHMDESGHRALGLAVASTVLNLFGLRDE